MRTANDLERTIGETAARRRNGNPIVAEGPAVEAMTPSGAVAPAGPTSWINLERVRG